MKKLALSGVLTIIVSIGLFGFSFGIGFADCFKDECFEPAYSAAAIVGLLGIVVGLVLILASFIVLAKNNPKKWYWLLLVLLLYVLVGYGVYYNMLDGDQYFKKRSFISNFKTPYLTPSYLPPGTNERGGSFYTEGDTAVYGSGSYSIIVYQRPRVSSDGSTDYKTFEIEQGDQMNDAAGVLEFCGQKYECDVINGKNIKNIHCQQTNSWLCAVEVSGTYISIRSSNDVLTREEAVAILDSMTEKQ